MKNQIIVLPSGDDIVDVVAGIPGSKSDINLFRERQKRFASRQKFKEIKLIKENNQSRLQTKNQKKEK